MSEANYYPAGSYLDPNETWKPVPLKEFENLYEISNYGKVRSKGTYNTCKKGIMNPMTDTSGYYHVMLYNKGISKDVSIHRLVALAFIPNPDNKATVNHINCDRSDNRAENLEWTTYRENNDYAIKVMRDAGGNKRNNKSSRPVEQLDMNGNVINEFPSYREAERQTGISAIDKVCAGSKYRKTAGGFKWRYKDSQ